MKLSGCTIELMEGDITDMKTVAIVNAANENLVLGGGVAGAIRQRGGPTIQEECYRIGGTEVGSAVITGAGDLEAKFVIHAVGPRLGEGGEEQKLASAVKSSLELCDEHKIDSIAFPAISAGIFGYPAEECASVMLQTVLSHLQKEKPTNPREIIFCLYGEKNYNVFRREMSRYDPSYSD
jgi:O-acetyl-ADP-ribose deacetylase (regulator of RNase III)